MENFTPLTATIGGVLIGIASTVMWVFAGRLAGISGIAGGIYPLSLGSLPWRLLFLAALPVGAIAGHQLGPMMFDEIPATAPVIGLSPLWLVIGGVLVGVGTRLGNGCTSGHGICGLSRLSARSFVAVVVFMVTAFITVFIARHVV